MQSSSASGFGSWSPALQRLPSWFRFLLFGGANTALTFGIFILLGLLIAPAFAYTFAFFIGIIFVATMSNKWVFRGTETFEGKILYVGWYLIVFLIGQAVIGLIGPVGLAQLIGTSGLLIGVTVPINFAGGKLIFRHESGES